MFVAEAKDHLLDLCTGLLQLEQPEGKSTPERMEPLQRAIHSIKGGAGFFELRTLEQLAHHMETALGAPAAAVDSRKNNFTDILLEATDFLAELLDDQNLGEQRDISSILEKLDRLKIDKTIDCTSASSSAQPIPDPVFDCEFELSAMASVGVTPQDLVSRISAQGRILTGTLITSPVNLKVAPPAPPYLWQVRIQSHLEKQAFLLALGLPEPDGVIRPEIQRSAQSPDDAAEKAENGDAPRARVTTSNRSSTIRIPIDLIDQLMSLAGELVLVRNQAKRYSVSLQALPGQVMQRLDAVTSAFQDTVLQTRMQPVATVFNKYPRLVRDLSRQLNKQIELQIVGGEVELDKNILEALSDPLTHLIRNACDHGLESPAERLDGGKSPTGKIQLEARHLGDQILISFTDDGRGINRQAVRNKTLTQGLRTSEELDRLDDRELLALILQPGFSTAAKVSDLSGRGVGMDVVKNNLAAIGGSIEIESQEGRGTTFLLRLPLTLAIIPTLLVVAGGERYALPQKDIEELVHVDPAHSEKAIERKTDGEVVRLRGSLLPLVRLAETLEGKASPLTPQKTAAVYAVVRSGSRRFGLVLDNILNNEEIVVKPLHTALKHLPMYSGATVLGDGRVALILNPEGIAQRARVHFHAEGSPEFSGFEHAAADSLSILRVRQCDGRLLGIPMVDVLRIVMCHQETTERIGGQSYIMIAERPTQILTSLEQSSIQDSLPLSAPFFVVLLKHNCRDIGLAVTEVIGAEWVAPTAIHDLQTGSGLFRAAISQGTLFPLAHPRAEPADSFASETKEATGE